MPKEFLQRNHAESKDFKYTKGKMSLSFVFRTDIKRDMKDFLECLEAAVDGVKEQLNKI